MKEYLDAYMRKDGDLSGITNANLNFSNGAERFGRMPPEDEVWIITRLLCTIEDVGTFATTEYGAGQKLISGLDFYVDRSADGTLGRENVSCRPIRTNGDWKSKCFDAEPAELDNIIFVARWSFFKGGFDGIVLRGNLGEGLWVDLEDDMSHLSRHEFIIQGNRQKISTMEDDPSDELCLKVKHTFEC